MARPARAPACRARRLAATGYQCVAQSYIVMKLHRMLALRRRTLCARSLLMINLRSVDVEIPHGSFTVVTGVSGSGKTSLAFDTLFSEGQRRYLAALSSHARQFLGKMQRPAADSFVGLPPALGVDQRTTVRNPRSTVGTLTEVYDHLRLLFAGISTPRDPDTRLHLGSFSFNSKDGACPTCNGLAVIDQVDPELLIADRSATLRQGALVPTTSPATSSTRRSPSMSWIRFAMRTVSMSTPRGVTSQPSSSTSSSTVRGPIPMTAAAAPTQTGPDRTLDELP